MATKEEREYPYKEWLDASQGLSPGPHQLKMSRYSPPPWQPGKLKLPMRVCQPRAEVT